MKFVEFTLSDGSEVLVALDAISSVAPKRLYVGAGVQTEVRVYRKGEEGYLPVRGSYREVVTLIKEAAQ